MVAALKSLSLSAIDGKRTKRFLVLRKKERTTELVEGEGKAESEGKREHLKFECVSIRFFFLKISIRFFLK